MNREKISEHFYRDEYECLCGCGFNVVDVQLNKIHEELRKHFGVPVYIVRHDVPADESGSACRCPKHNKDVGGSETSQHLFGKAGDTVVDGIEPIYVYNFLNNRYPDILGLGVYNNFVHIDTRRRKARWDNR